MGERLTVHPRRSRLARAATMLALLPMLLGCSSIMSSCDSRPAQYEDSREDTVLLQINTLMVVQNGGTEPTLELSADHTITEIMTYHWNDATGATPGEILLTSADGNIYGPWQAEGREGQGGVANAYWHVYPDETLPAGTYTVVDSDPATWAQNEETGGLGVTFVYGVPAQ